MPGIQVQLWYTWGGRERRWKGKGGEKIRKSETFDRMGVSYDDFGWEKGGDGYVMKRERAKQIIK